MNERCQLKSKLLKVKLRHINCVLNLLDSLGQGLHKYLPEIQPDFIKLPSSKISD